MGGEGHEQYEQMAVGHVLGGLPTQEAAVFRSHLVGCVACRQHVAELRDIAADLLQAEREERQQAATKTEVVRREQAPSTHRRWRGLSRRAFPVAILTGVFVAMALLFWTSHLRRVATFHEQVALEHAAVLDALTSGEDVAVSYEPPIDAQVAVHDRHVAVSVAGLPDLAPDQRLVVWGLGPAGDGWAVDLQAGQLADGRLRLRLPVGGATELVVSLEHVPLDRSGPRGEVLLRGSLPPRATVGAPPN